QIETNLFGPLWVTKAVVPLLRGQRSGHIIQVSSIGGVMAFPMLGLYHASKWGLEGFTQSLAAELAEFGVHVTLVEPGGFATDWSGTSAGRGQGMAAYDGGGRGHRRGGGGEWPALTEYVSVVCRPSDPCDRNPATRRRPAPRFSSSSMPP